VKLLRGKHAALNYRGNAVKRSKIWLQKHFDAGMLKYGYTGWQWLVSFAQKRMEEMPLINAACDKLNTFTHPLLHFNHAIGTVYRDGGDNIGFHSDKVAQWTPGSVFIALKLGGARHFQFASAEGAVFFDEKLNPGTAVIVGSDANQATKHAVPVEALCKEASGSVVFRSIATCVPWTDVLKEALASARQKEQSVLKKIKRGVEGEGRGIVF
jgi:hypothetical protein